MDWKNQLTKTPYLVLFILLGSIGVGTASALIMITLSGNVIITDDLTVDSNTFAVDSINDRVGVGTLNPQEDLHVAGDLRLDGGLSFSDFQGNNHIFEFSDDLFLQSKDDTVFLASDRIFLDNDIVVDTVNNRVGVGTTLPQSKLHVVGDCIGCMKFYEVIAVSPTPGINNLSCSNGDRVISGGGWTTSNQHWIRESWAIEIDTWRLAMTDVNGNDVTPGAFKIICADLNGNN